MTGPRIGVAVMLMVLTAPFAYFLLPVPVSERSLTNSIERETRSAALSSECSEIVDGRWRCHVNDSSGSGTSDYAVDTGFSCWHARRTADDAEVPMPRRPDGCAKLRDFLGLFDLLVG